MFSLARPERVTGADRETLARLLADRYRSHEARERVSVLNLRHSLSTALVALRATNHASWTGQLNVNRMLATGLDHAFTWLDHPTFINLL